MSHHPPDGQPEVLYFQVARGLVDAARAIRAGPPDVAETRRALVDGYRVEVSVKRIPSDDERYHVYGRRFLVLFRVDRQAARQSGLPAETAALDRFLLRQERALDELFRSQDGRCPVFDTRVFDLWAAEEHHADRGRWRCALWSVGIKNGRHLDVRRANAD